MKKKTDERPVKRSSELRKLSKAAACGVRLFVCMLCCTLLSLDVDPFSGNRCGSVKGSDPPSLAGRLARSDLADQGADERG